MHEVLFAGRSLSAVAVVMMMVRGRVGTLVDRRFPATS
jgi:hypothetical protein